MSESIENAKIANVSLTISEYDSLTFYVRFEGAAWACSIGGYKMGSAHKDYWSASGVSLVAMMKIMDIVGVSEWEALKHKYCRVRIENQEITAIGNLLENRWFYIKDFYKLANENAPEPFVLDERKRKNE